MFKIFIFLNFLVYNYCCYKNKKNNINNFEISTNNEDFNGEAPRIKEKDKEKDENIEKNKDKKTYLTTSFYHDGLNCIFQTVFLDLMVIFDYFPELFENFKNYKNIIKDNCDVKYKKEVIDEIVNLRERYLKGETGLDVHKIYDIFINFNEKYIQSLNFDDFIKNKNYRDFFDIFYNIVDLTETKLGTTYNFMLINFPNIQNNIISYVF